MAAGAKRRLVTVGGVVSDADLTSRDARKPARAIPSASRIRVFPAASDKNTVASVHWPGSLCGGKVIVIELDADRTGANLAEPPCLLVPDGLTKLSSM